MSNKSNLPFSVVAVPAVLLPVVDQLEQRRLRALLAAAAAPAVRPGGGQRMAAQNGLRGRILGRDKERETIVAPRPALKLIVSSYYKLFR